MLSIDRLPALLPAVVEAARAGGALLFAEFHQPGGPRGGGDSADVDAEVERLLAERLLALDTDTAFLGEETGALGPEGAAWRWHVDPNDGTAPFLKGGRGSAVSIGLCLDGVPVLGVVFAPLAPDDGGDLFTWAEGAALCRNGAPVAAGPLPVALAHTEVVAVSQHADRAAAANARGVAPARYRAMPSIAYRLALAAAGEVAAATSVGGPWSWDLAGGHALLRGAGGEVVGADGQPLRYPGRAGRFPLAVGGSLPLARALAARDWSKLAQDHDPEPNFARWPLITPRRDRVVAGAGLLARAHGCLLGQIAGDALGQLVEFESARAIAARYPAGVRRLADGGTWNTLAGQPTDDSEMALLLARSIVAEGAFHAPRAFEAYQAWGRSGPFDMGGTTAAGLQGRPSAGSQANGALMRVSPLAIYGHALPAEALVAHARADAALTHPHPLCGDASAAFCVAIAHALREGDGPQAAHAAALGWAKATPGVQAALIEDLEGAVEGPPAEFQHQMGWVRIALRNAFYELLHANSIEEGLSRTVGRGGDTDTNAAIAGALLGAVHGREAIPAQWRQAVLCCRPLPGSPRPRPKALWPVDALQLAEALLAVGRAASVA